MRLAIIDLGTNTFNLLIAEKKEGIAKKIFKTKIPVRLGEGGLEKKKIMPAPYARAKDAIKQFKDISRKFEVKEYMAFGTSALRNAVNGPKFVAEVFKEYGINIQVISGLSEAEFIWYGVRSGIELTEEPSLILDIGGGSNEFIITTKTRLLWKGSYDLGIARLLEKFKPADPFKKEDIKKITDHCDAGLKTLDAAMKEHKPFEIIGSAGSFDSFAQLCTGDPPVGTSYEFDLEKFFALEKLLLNSKHEERKTLKGLVSFRVDMIVPAVLFTAHVIRKYKFKNFRMTTHSLKEGVLEKWALGKMPATKSGY